MATEPVSGKTAVTPGDLSDALAVVVGASSGIGAEIAAAMAAAGAHVVVAARSAARLEPIAKRISDDGGRVVVEEVDVASPESIAAFRDRVLRTTGSPTILVNSAGYSLTKYAFEVTLEEWNACHDVNVRGTFFTCQAFGPAMADAGYGKIINLSSTWADSAGVRRTVYCASKAAVSHLTSALATEWAPMGIRVNGIAPCATRTPRVADWFEHDPDREQFLTARIPLGRLAVPEDVAGAAVFLGSPQSDFVTGHTLYVDGGFRASKL